jgi:hypothetical protein
METPRGSVGECETLLLSHMAAPKPSQLHDELITFFSTDPKFVEDVIVWWCKKCTTYPCLSQMTLDYLTLPGKFLSISLILCMC